MDKQGLRSGYTTGSCAAAGAKAAALAIVGGRQVDEVEITLPRGEHVCFTLQSCRRHSDMAAECSVIKDAGDDPDVTHGAEIFTRIDLEPPPGLRYRAGQGIGTVTKPGLELAVGEPAINPMPRRMIRQALEEVLGDAWARVGVTVTISILNGEELAKQTLNGRLGILGGLSILGTTGIVEPYSNSAFKVSILKAIRVARSNGCDHLVLTPGGRSETFAQRVFALPEEAFIEVGGFLKQAIAYCRRNHPRQVTFGGFAAKFSKVAAGQLETHSDEGPVDFPFLADVGAMAGLPTTLVQKIRGATLAREVFGWIKEEPAGPTFFQLLCQAAQRSLADAAQGAFISETILFDFDGSILGHASEDASANVPATSPL
jgi:cobalt-precorrin-5B (C1)-methyltransferase